MTNPGLEFSDIPVHKVIIHQPNTEKNPSVVVVMHLLTQQKSAAVEFDYSKNLQLVGSQRRNQPVVFCNN